MNRESEDASLTPELRRLNLAEQTATLAWATAIHARSAPEAAQLVREAVAGAGTTNVQSQALVHYQCGCAFEAVGNVESSVQHYQTPATIDPQGGWGRQALAALARLAG